MFRITTIRQQADAFGQYYAVQQRRAPLLARIVLALVGLAAVLLFLVLLIPILLIGAVIALITLARAALRRWFTRAHEPNGVLDGRKNVRVIRPDEG